MMMDDDTPQPLPDDSMGHEPTSGGDHDSPVLFPLDEGSQHTPPPRKSPPPRKPPSSSAKPAQTPPLQRPVYRAPVIVATPVNIPTPAQPVVTVKKPGCGCNWKVIITLWFLLGIVSAILQSEFVKGLSKKVDSLLEEWNQKEPTKEEKYLAFISGKIPFSQRHALVTLSTVSDSTTATVLESMDTLVICQYAGTMRKRYIIEPGSMLYTKNGKKKLGKVKEEVYIKDGEAITAMLNNQASARDKVVLTDPAFGKPVAVKLGNISAYNEIALMCTVKSVEFYDSSCPVIVYMPEAMFDALGEGGPVDEMTIRDCLPEPLFVFFE